MTRILRGPALLLTAMLAVVLALMLTVSDGVSGQSTEGQATLEPTRSHARNLGVQYLVRSLPVPTTSNPLTDHAHLFFMKERPTTQENALELHYYMPAWNGQEFDVVTVAPRISSSTSSGITKLTVHLRGIGSGVEEPYESGMFLYYPIDPRMKLSDVQGATRAEPNADNTGWLFFHTDDGTHHDIGLSIEAGVQAVFRPEIDGVMTEILALDPRDTPHGRKVAEHKTLVKVQGSVLVEAVKAHNARYLGHYHQSAHPEDGHVLSTVQAAFAKVKAEWAASSSLRSQWSGAAAALGRIETGLTTRASVGIEDRWTQEARIAAELKAAA